MLALLEALLGAIGRKSQDHLPFYSIRSPQAPLGIPQTMACLVPVWQKPMGMCGPAKSRMPAGLRNG